LNITVFNDCTENESIVTLRYPFKLERFIEEYYTRHKLVPPWMVKLVKNHNISQGMLKKNKKKGVKV